MATAQKEIFFEKMDELGLALTFDDVRMRTRSGQGELLPEDIDTTSKFSEAIELKIPIVSAAMDTVTESRMAIEMAKLGGLGVIHAAMSIDDQYRQVRRVKKAANGLIEEPISVLAANSLQQILQLCDEKDYEFRTFPVKDAEGKLVGVLTSKDFEFPESTTELAGDVMTPLHDVVNAPAGTDLESAYKIMQQSKRTMLPLVNDEDGTIAGLYLWSDTKRNIREAGKYNVDSERRLKVAAAISTGKDALERVDRLSKYVDVIVIDSADGDSYYVFETLRAIKSQFPDLQVVVGNISDGASALELAEAGANGIKVGQGPGSICSTRRETGIGMPQVTAVYECVKALSENFPHIPVCADGGIRDHGDIPIAIAAGAHSVMMGRVLAGTLEAPGRVITRSNGSRVKLYRGMGSASALMVNQASRERYGSGGNGIILPEGIEGYVPYTGEVKEEVGLCVAALKKGMRYVKAPNIEFHRENTLLRRITNAGLLESHPHDIEHIAPFGV